MPRLRADRRPRRCTLAVITRLALALAIGLIAFLPRELQAQASSRRVYSLQVDLRYAEAVAEVVQTVHYRNSAGVPLDRIVFQVTPAYYGAFLSLDASADGVPLESNLDGTVLDVPLAAPLDAGETVTLRLQYRLDVPRQLGRFGAGPRALALGNWFPILAPHRGDWFRGQYVEIGDAFFTEVADFEVHLTTDVPLQVAHSGEVLDHDDALTWRLGASSLRDFALVVSPEFVHTRETLGAVAIDSFAFDSLAAERAAVAAKRYLEWYGETLGGYPYPELDVVALDLPSSYGGMEYPALVMMEASTPLPDPPDGSYAEYLLAHEIAHQWFYSRVGNDQVHDPWLDESLATYLPLLYDRIQRPDQFPSAWSARIAGGYADRVQAAGDLPADSGIHDFSAEGPYNTIVYRKGAHYLGSLNDRLGDDAMVSLLREYVTTFQDKIATPRAFLDLAQRRTADNLNPLGADHFSYGMLTYPTPQSWSLDVPSGSLDGTVSISVAAEFPIDRLEILLDSQVLYDGTSVTPLVDLNEVPAGEYLLLVRLTNSEGALFERALRVRVA